MSLEQIIVLAVVQGVTEFLPISSSGHLILVPALTGWPDQGQLTDVMVHFGTLLAILIYFWRDVLGMIKGGLALLTGKLTPEGRLALYIVIATIPAVIFGVILKKFGFTDLERNVSIVAWNTLLYGVLMLITDRIGPQIKTLADVTLPAALVHRRGSGACAHSRHEPVGRHHDRGPVSRLHPARFRALLLSARHPRHGRRHRLHRGRRDRLGRQGYE
jgi:undecaprenyl pyrophosphate phosphatase UppP